MQRFIELIHAFAGRVQAWAEGLGGPGLMMVAFIDSSFLTLPEVADILLVLFTIREPSRWWYFSAMTTLGSMAGSYALFLVGRKGGEAMLRRNFHERHVDRGLEWFKKYGAFVLIVPAMLPPPMPFKIFVLLAGVSGVSRGPFLGALAAGRGARYGGEALLARAYGEPALDFVTDNAWRVFLPAVGLLVGALAIWWLWRSRQQRRIAPGNAPPPARDTH
jgi:membrane protein YqaA with SNARE-associated domain